MKKVIFACLISFLFFGAVAQRINPNKALADSLHKLKKEGKLTNYEGIIMPSAGEKQNFIISRSAKHQSKNNARGNNNNSVMSTSCNCWIPRDTSFHRLHFNNPNGNNSTPTAPLYQIDDASSYGVPMPFNFCFNGTTAGGVGDSMYINSNGIVTFGNNFTTFSPVSFPCTYVSGTSPGAAIAPFWGDVDTETPFTSGGGIYLKITPTYMIIQWDSVGVFDHTGQINSFQLILTNGTDPILPTGNNISFCYGEMQWTTGDASGGGGTGFGGTSTGAYPATVGINAGDGVNYSQISLFDNGGSAYTNPAGIPASGVGWLVGKSFYFNSCAIGGGVPPVPLAGGANPCAGDTLSVCAVGDTLSHTVSFGPGNPTQTVSVTATAPSLGSNFSISSSTSGATASLTFHVNTTGLSAPGNYNVSVTATNSGGLSTTVNYVIHILGSSLPNPSITVNPSITCGSTPPVITLANSSSYASWTWSTGASSPSATTSVASTSTVQVTVTSSGGCQKTGSVFVPIYPTPTVSIAGVLNYCAPTTSTSISAIVSGGTSPYSYNWNHGLASTNTLSATGTGTGTNYTVVVTDLHGCKDSTMATVTSGSVTLLNITSAGSLCTGQDTLFSSITGASSYTWTPGGITTNPYIIIGSTPGTYNLALTINNCPVSASLPVPPPVVPTLTITGNTSICAGQTTTLSVVASPTATSGYTYNWFNGATNISTTNTVSINAAGTSYFVTAVNNNTLCKGINTFTISIAPNPTVTIVPKRTYYCRGFGDTLSAVVAGGTSPFNYTWTPGGGNTDTVYVVPTSSVSETYTVVVKDVNGCTAHYSKKINSDKLNLVIPPTYICPGSSTIIHAHAVSGTIPYTYTWNPGPISGSTYTASLPGIYSVTVKDANGCKATAPATVSLYPKPVANFTYTPSPATQNSPVTFMDNSTIASPDSVKWDMWVFGDGDTVIANPNPVHTYANGGTYTVTLVVASEFGCLDTITHFVNVQYNIIAPNIITPNGDGINEFLAFKNLQYFNNNKIWIYNRWGTQLYQSSDYKNDWTGKDYSDGTYFYILDVPDKGQTLKGFFESLK